MASDRSSNPPSPNPGPKPVGRTSPVLVPQGSLEGQPEIPLNRPVTTVGSNEGARLHLLSRTVSKGHAIFVNSGGATYVADLASRTGTLVNGKAVRDAELKNGDRVQIGKFVFRYRMPANLGTAVETADAPPAAVIVVGWPAFPIPGRAVSIGRESRADISLSDDAAVSASHAVIFQIDGQWVIRDMGSRTGTLINGKKIHQQVLNFGDRVTIGSSTVLFQPGASTEDDFSTVETPADEEFTQPAEAGPLEEIAFTAEAVPVPNDDEFPLTDDEPSHVSDWKTAFPLPVEEPVAEAASPLEIVEPETLPVEPLVEPTPVEDVALPLAEAQIPTVEEETPDAIEPEIAPFELEAETAEPRSVEIENEPTLVESDPVAEAAEPALPVAEVPVDDVIDWGEISSTDATEAAAELEPPATEPTPVEPVAQVVGEAIPLAEEPVQVSPVVDESADDATDWNATVSADLPVEETIAAVEPQVPMVEPAVIEEPMGVDDALESLSEDDLVEIEPPAESAAEEAPAIAVDSAVQDVAEIETEVVPLAESPLETPLAPAIDPQAPAEEFVFVPANAAVDPNAVPDVLFWGDPEVDAASEQAATPALPAAPVQVQEEPIASQPQAAPTPPVIEPVAADAAFDALMDEAFAADNEEPIAIEPLATTELPVVDAADTTTNDAAFDAAMEESFAAVEEQPISLVPELTPQSAEIPAELPAAIEHADDAAIEDSPADADEKSGELVAESEPTAPEQFLEQEEIAIPSDLAAFSRASETTAESYGEAAPHAQAPTEPIALPTPDNSHVVVEELPEFIDVAAEPASESLDVVDLDFLETEPEVTASDESAIGWTALADQDESVGEEQIAVSEGLTVDPAAQTDEPDLDFFGLPDEVAEVTPETTAPPIVDEAGEDPASIGEAPKPSAQPDGLAHGPSIFGIQFEGGSFLGGMPISLHEPQPISPKSSTVFDAKQVIPSGLDAMTPPPVIEPPAPPAVEPTAPPVIPRSNRPMTPPRPAVGSAGTAIAPTSLTGLVSEARTPWSGPPTIPPTVRSGAPKAQNRVRERMTTAFAAPGKAPRTAEVFSQMAAPIGVEVFGGKPGNPNQFTVPDSKETAAEQAAEAAAAIPAPVAPLAPAKKRRKSRLPWLSVLFVAVPAGLWALTYTVPPVSSRLVSAKLMGALQYDGLTNVPPAEGELFRRDQERRLYSEDVRTAAQMILQQKQQPAGFIDNSDDYAKAVNNQYLNWSGNTLQLSLNTSDAAAGSAQVNAVLTALAQKDRDLDDNKLRARAAANNAQAVSDDSAAHAQKLSEQRRTLLDQAQDSPDLSTVTDGDQEAAALTKKWTDARTMRENSEAILADLRGQDLSKPIDIEADSQVVDLKKRLDPLIEQIARLKGISAINAGAVATVGTNVPEGAATQPAAEVDPLLAPLQQQADLLNKKLDQRRAELAVDASMSPAQREVNMASRIENLSVKITAMQKAESDAKAAADAATAKAAENHAKMSAARLAGVKSDELYAQLNDAQTEHSRAVQAQSDAEAALANCVTVAVAPSTPLMISTTDLRRPIWAGLSALSCFILGLMIAGELRRPKLMVAGVTPAAAPLVHPPARVIPWPEPSELNGLESNGNDPPIMGEPDQVFGGV